MVRTFSSLAATMLGAAFLVSGCASWGAHSEGPRSDIYPGVRADAHSLAHPKADDSEPVLSAIDLPFSFVWDTLCLPFFDGPAAIIHACRSKPREQDHKPTTQAPEPTATAPSASPGK